MKLPRRNFLHLAAGAAALSAVSRIARAQTYPTRPVRLIVPAAAGGAADTAARITGQWLSEQLAQSIIVENRALPDLPTVGNFVTGYEASQWFGFCAPKNTPTEIVDRLNKQINAGLANPKIKARFADLGVVVIPGSPADFGKLITDETEKWAKVIKFANIKPE